MSAETLRPSGEELMEMRRKYFAHPTWETVYGNLELQTHNRPIRHARLERNKSILREFYGAWFKVVTGAGYGALNRFNEKYLAEVESPLKFHLNMIRSTMTSPQPGQRLQRK